MKTFNREVGSHTSVAKLSCRKADVTIGNTGYVTHNKIIIILFYVHNITKQTAVYTACSVKFTALKGVSVHVQENVATS